MHIIYFLVFGMSLKTFLFQQFCTVQVDKSKSNKFTGKFTEVEAELSNKYYDEVVLDDKDTFIVHWSSH